MNRRGNVKGHMKAVLAVFCCLFVLLGAYLLYTTVAYGSQWFQTPYNPRIAAGNNIENAGTIYDRNGVPLAYTQNGERRYAEDEDMRRAVSHAVGDVYGKSQGAETYYAKYLYGYDQNMLDKYHSVSSGKKGGDVYLTIDAALCEFMYDNMSSEPGAAVLMNYKTGEILAAVSKPTFDPLKAKEDTDEVGAKFIDRVTQGLYPPGSTMKIVTAAAAIENGITDFEYDCTGSDTIEGQKITCVKEGGHGHMDLESAFASSCNVYFGELATKIGKDALLETAEDFAFNYNFSFPELTVYNSSFEASDNNGDLAWAGIGQYKDLATPLHELLIASGVANGGTVMQPTMLSQVRYGGQSSHTAAPVQFREIMSFTVASQIEEMMRSAVASGTAASADVDGLEVCGKTGTAEYVDPETGEVKNHSWFVGFSANPAHPLAVAVIGEGQGFGSAYATPLAGAILEKAVQMGY